VQFWQRQFADVGVGAAERKLTAIREAPKKPSSVFFIFISFFVLLMDCKLNFQFLETTTGTPARAIISTPAVFFLRTLTGFMVSACCLYSRKEAYKQKRSS